MVFIIVTVVCVGVSCPDLFLFVVEALSKQDVVVFEWAWHNSVEVKVTIHVSRNETVVRLQELANLHLWKRFVAVIEGNKHALSLLILMILDADCTII